MTCCPICVKAGLEDLRLVEGVKEPCFALSSLASRCIKTSGEVCHREIQVLLRLLSLVTFCKSHLPT